MPGLNRCLVALWLQLTTFHYIISISGRDILKRNGSAVDAAIATFFCLGLFSMHSTGIGGGGCMLVYIKESKTIEAFDYQSSAPGKAREDMFMGEGNKSSIGDHTCDKITTSNC